MWIRAQLQRAEMLGHDNKWYCAEYYGRMIENEDVLAEYYIRTGGAIDFDRRFIEAMSLENRYYCSQFYGRDIRDPVILWEYYMTHAIFPVAIAC
jgi:hypothetical protein